MTVLDILRRSWHNIGRAKVRVGLTAAALAIGGATMTLALAITQGAQDSIEKGFGQFKDTFVNVEGFAAPTTSENGLQKVDESDQTQPDVEHKPLGVKDVDAFKIIPGVQKVIPLNYYKFDEVIINGSNYEAPTVQPFIPATTTVQIVAGKIENLKGDTVVVPERYTKEAGFTHPADFIGKQLTFIKKGRPGFLSLPGTPDRKITLTVVGITKSDNAHRTAFSEYAYLAPETMSSLAEEDQDVDSPADLSYQQILVVTDEDKTESVKNQLRDQGYEATSRQDSVGEVMQAIAAVRMVLLVFAGIAIMTAIFGVINTQLMSVLERTREIGIMKALGLSRGGILLLFSIEAGWIGLIGSLAGTLLALPFALLIGFLGKSSSFAAPITLPNFLLVVIVLVVIAMLSGLLPARRAAKLDPVEALRSE